MRISPIIRSKRSIPRTRLSFWMGSMILGLGILFGDSCKTKEWAPPINIATAANMQYAMTQLTQQFTEKTGIPCHIIVSSSGKLTAQIQAGAPFDIFVSADSNYPDFLYAQGHGVEPPQIYAYGKLVTWSLKDSVSGHLERLSKASVDHIALANPETAPYGRAAVEVLRHLELYDSVQDKLVYGESIAQVNQFVFSGSAAVGFTALAAVRADGSTDQGYWQEIPEHLYSPIAQGVLLLRQKDKNPEASEAFFNYLFSLEARQVLKQFGYRLPDHLP